VKRFKMPLRPTTKTIVLMSIMLMIQGWASPSQAADASIRTVTDDPTAWDYMPEFSPDGRLLLFERGPLIGGHSVRAYVVPFEGGDIKPLSAGDVPVNQTRMRWSPRGNLIAFTGAGPGNTTATWLMDKDGSHIRRGLLPQVGNGVYPGWYPDGQRILETVSDDNTLRSVNIQSGAVVKIVTAPALKIGMATVSPDGKWIAAAAQLRQGQPYNQDDNQIWIIGNDGHAHRLIAAGHQGRAPTWSPDGRKVVFESNQGSPKPTLYAIFLANVDGTGLQQLTPFDHNAVHPVFSPDGKWIAFSERTAKALGAHAQGVAVMRAP
jgi:Tol biopolymer transport system component